MTRRSATTSRDSIIWTNMYICIYQQKREWGLFPFEQKNKPIQHTPCRYHVVCLKVLASAAAAAVAHCGRAGAQKVPQPPQAAHTATTAATAVVVVLLLLHVVLLQFPIHYFSSLPVDWHTHTHTRVCLDWQTFFLPIHLLYSRPEERCCDTVFMDAQLHILTASVFIRCHEVRLDRLSKYIVLTD